ncbi:MAG: ABC transporter ATP-binding protein, partial [Ideonella sp.]|nr:ABC transporter ATP-binding protein [Ideonella sp.]
HDLAVVGHLCRRLMVMHRGRVVERLSAEDLAAGRVQAAATRLLVDAAVGFRRTPLPQD